MRLRNTSPLGDIEIVGIGPVAADDVFEATGAHATDLQRQGFPLAAAREPRKPRTKTPTKTGEVTTTEGKTA